MATGAEKQAFPAIQCVPKPTAASAARMPLLTSELSGHAVLTAARQAHVTWGGEKFGWGRVCGGGYLRNGLAKGKSRLPELQWGQRWGQGCR